MLTGIILAGGRNSRMQGQNKALLTYEGERFIDRQLKEMHTLCRRIIVVTNDASPYQEELQPEITYIPDIYAGHGPLSGFHAAFTEIGTEGYAWVVGCDSPDISAPAASWMLTRLMEGGYDAVLPVIHGKHQMLHGIYRPERMLPRITERLEAGHYRLSGLLDYMHWLGVDKDELAGAGIHGHFTADIDTPEQYKAWLLQQPAERDDLT
ncbi:molybdenum cofactor guanylyltransferase [Paenibacillus sp. MMS20-IR301]|uniref:molybdenum cofactor guanylyltransferase n=1 Tax=Paenibacillus sp. MMS20-IR301 TaxID=2895946 RepID=UPI0028EB2D57|nr:molybdenum cofactor guanylyltransferase [Paenibacillus sp. MMS20-IR301]WNS40691.1 molybdenum cofactor guanylyltransferase [Paenibacillus sp. MMS20-IR301]